MDFSNIFDFFNMIYDFITSGIYDLIKDAVVWMLSKLLIMYYHAAMESVQFAWSVASGIIDELNLSADINSTFAALPANVSQILAFFRVPEFINIVLSAFGTRFILKFIPFI